MKRAALGGLALAALAAAGCAGALGGGHGGDATERDPLVGYEWRLVAVESRDTSEDRTPLEPALYTLELLKDGRVKVRADCNEGEGRWARDGAKLSFPGLTFGGLDCGADSLFEDVAQGLAAVETYSFRDGHLFLLEGASNELLEYTPVLDEPGDAS